MYKIKSSMSAFTETDRSIAEFVFVNRQVVLESNAKELGDMTKTSAAAWVRFSKKMGYKGLPAFKVALAKETQSYTNEDDIETFLNPQDSLMGLLQKTENMLTQNIRETFSLLDYHALEKAIEFIHEAKTVFLLGVGGSSIVCLDFYHKMTRIHQNVMYDRDLHTLMPRIAQLDKNDVVLVISYNGETESVNSIAKVAKTMGARIVGVTKYNLKSTLSTLSDIRLFVPVEEKEIRLGSITSRNSLLTITDLLYYGIAKTDFNVTKDLLVRTRQFIKEVE
ncbi:MurR/RpiR family transcriptional regulator [Granulicatella adiacens ATCC 49175]|uniref:MurR/RpiR family transcriptional regulator n=1 Tax=Granulicatella adiacens TaxID=46124 RepID=UPI0021A4E390|nr:MurR/RpiR family transcriptional regulator [Granulicatella adiacens]UAK94439.1 MurR/RpiR family transcriptional regulator [Granulicatella adiacens]UWP38319.1 MurR/RpiR family transcriptional regulator [Granulicatella adiacens ATCC 49175]